MKIDIQAGDFAIVDSTRTPAKIVKYLMRSPTLYHDLFRMIIKKLEVPLHYHAVMFINKDLIIEQQGEVLERSTDKILNTNNRLFIFRMKNGISDLEKKVLISNARSDIGHWYGVMSCIGKTLTWLTNIKFFARYIHILKTEICINLVCKWYYNAFGELFGKKTYLESTTWSVYKYVIAHPEKFDIIYDGIPREDNLKESLL